MKPYSIPTLCLFLTLGCNQSTESSSNKNLPAQEKLNLAYGNDPQQKMDIYLPAGRDENTKTIILLHGGGWSGGSKSDISYFVPVLKNQFPDHAIVNMNYRLGTSSSPGFPKQIQDIEKAIAHLQNGSYDISNEYAFIGASAGAHLAMLYAYRHDPGREVKAVVSIVGPADFNDPAYTGNPLFQFGLSSLIGYVNVQKNPELYLEVSPATHVSAQSPPTAMFYGGQDPLIPASQGPRLKAKLDQYNVPNELHLYPSGGHGNWSSTVNADFQTKLIAFLKKKF